MRSDRLGMIGGLGEVVTCVYGPSVTYAFPDTLVAAYRDSIVYVSLISVLWRRKDERGRRPPSPEG